MRCSLGGIDSLGTPSCSRSGFRVAYTPAWSLGEGIGETFLGVGCTEHIIDERKAGASVVLIPDEWTIDVDQDGQNDPAVFTSGEPL